MSNLKTKEMKAENEVRKPTTVCVRLVAQPQKLINCTTAICAINFTLCYSQLLNK